ncbi:unnamed protein product [Soboliphyme baturini]|uniref:Large ribosomal subunit protein eL13 n=1 Tax=Soboliphyme baturini TaxID=241478 RepID=A0A183J727_9BILA|nr:unnamed protein product [Soboliphyme baturini]
MTGCVKYLAGDLWQHFQAAGIPKRYAPTIGIAVDHRRTNKSLESLQINVQRLKEYQSRLIIFPFKAGKPRKGDSSAEECKLATQLRTTVMPLKKPIHKVKARAITDEERKFEAYATVRHARADAKLVGYRQKKREALDNAITRK